MSFNGGPFNSFVYNGKASSIIATGGGRLVDIEQKVVVVGSGRVVDIEQVVEFFETGSGRLVDIEQNVVNTASGRLVDFAQNVVSDSALPKGYDFAAFLGGLQIPASEISGTCDIAFSEDSAAVATLTLKKCGGEQDLTEYFGKDLVITGTGKDAITYRIFTGVVDIVDFDIIDGKTTLEATNRRKELLEAIPSPEDKFGTSYDTRYLINQELEGADLIEALLPFAPFSLDFDAYNNYRYTAWEPKATADINLTGSDVLRADPQLENITRGRIVNEVNIDFFYQFSRLHYVETSYTWQAPYQADGTSFAPLVLTQGYSLTRKETIQAAIEGASWIVKNEVVFGGLPPAGWYNGLLWVGDTPQQSTQASRDINGDPITDSNGNTVYTTYSRRNYATEGVHASSANFTLTNRWTQQGIKKYSLTVSSASSQAVFGVVPRKNSYTITDAYDSERWDNYEGYAPDFEVGNGDTITLTGNQTYNVLTNEPIAKSNIQAAMDKAKTEILKTHRENLITIQAWFYPRVQLFHTLEIDTGAVSEGYRIQAKGKVKEYTHRLDFSGKTRPQTDIQIAFYSLGAGGSDDTYTLPVITPTNPDTVTSVRALDSVYGQDPDTEFYLKRDGWFGNKWPVASFFRTSFTEQFRVDTPRVPASLVDGIEYSNTGSYGIQIPTNSLTITYPECC